MKKNKKEIIPNKHFKITFTENKKYNPVTRTVDVYAIAKELAIEIVHRQFGSLKINRLMPFFSAPSNKIRIDTVVELDADGNIVPEEEIIAVDEAIDLQKVVDDIEKEVVGTLENKVVDAMAEVGEINAGSPEEISATLENVKKKPSTRKKKALTNSEDDKPTVQMVEKVN